MLDTSDIPLHNNTPPFITVTPNKTTVFPKHRVILAKWKQGIPLKQAMGEAGYSGGSLNNPNYTLTKTKSWNTLMEERLPEEELVKLHQELLKTRIQRPVKDSTGNTTGYVDQPDGPIVLKALDMAYKLHGSYKEPAAPPKSQNVYNLFYKPEVRAQVSAFEASLKQQMIHEASESNTPTPRTSSSPTGDSSHISG